MLLLNDMKAKFLGLYSGYTNKGAPALLWGVATLVAIGIGVVLIAISVFSDALLSGPELAISAPSVDSSAPGIVFVVPTSLEADGLRIAWAVASALVVFGIASILSAGASLVAGEYRTPIFRSSAGQTVRTRLAMGMVLATFGGLIRELFLKEGVFITLLGVIAGIILALVIYYIQVNFGIIAMAGSHIIQAYPIELRIGDILLVIAIVSFIGFIAALLPAKKAAEIPALIREE